MRRFPRSVMVDQRGDMSLTSSPVYRPSSLTRMVHRRSSLTTRSFQPPTTSQRTQEEDESVSGNEEFYRNHFSVIERSEMVFQKWSDIWNYRTRWLRRRFSPTWTACRRFLESMILIFILAKYVGDCFQISSNSDTNENIAHFHTELNRLTENHNQLLRHLERLENKLENYQVSKDDVSAQLSVLRERFEEFESKIGQIKEEAFISVRALAQEVDKVVAKAEEPKPVEPRKEENTTSAEFRISSSDVVQKAEGVNVASSLIGAKISDEASSRTASVMDSYIMQFVNYVYPSTRGGYAILERDIVQPGEAWCSLEREPKLTIRLARAARVKSVSYQHFGWTGIPPTHAPKDYDVVLCLTTCCSESVPLATDCTYGTEHDGNQVPEQFCVVNQEDVPVARLVQFRFRSNHGQARKTCAYLVRVYGDVIDDPLEATSQADGDVIKSVNSTFRAFVKSLPYASRIFE
ncbi:unnamed protein product [Caenorhabditis auriculariae]|uniref:SUN domain-containing protein n=1 Tax=Caenorhabditis auriculariae TaxID=2777116 RepID=A0A8S1HX33_9PELO|nr:unnamed protein product [Caenorhabditis auriculariae]